MILEEIKRHAKASLFKDPEGRIYTEFRGSFSWPREKDSFICVVAEEEKTANLRVVYEKRADSILNLAKELMAVRRLCSVEWVADIEGRNKNLNDTLYDITYSEEIEDQTVYPSQANLIQDDFHTALQILRREFQQNTLFLIKDGILFNIFQELAQRDTVESDIAERFCEIIVLASAVFDFPPHEQREEKYLPRDAWADAFDDDYDSGSFMGA